MVGCRKHVNECGTLDTVLKDRERRGTERERERERVREREGGLLVLDGMPLRSQVLGVLQQGFSLAK